MMKQQFLQEWYKFMYAWSVRIVFLLFLAGGIIAALTSRFTAYMAPFMGYDYWGVTGPILFAAIVAGQVAGEYQNGRAAKAAAETKRGQYFAAKIMGLFSLSVFFCLANTAVLSLLCYMKNGAGSGYFSHYPLQVAVFLLCRILIYWVYTAVFLLIGVLVRRRFLAFVLSCGAVYLETILWLIQQKNSGQALIGGPLTALMQSEKYIGMADFLSYDYYILFVPSVYAGCFALIIGFHLFRRGKLQIESRKKPIGNLVKKMLGLAVISVLLLFFGEAGICAEESRVPLMNQQSAENVGELRLVFGDRNLDDRDAFVLLLMADGFTEKEQEDFFKGVENLISALMRISPYDEFTDVTKIYALGTISGESGIKGDKADTWEQARQDSRDTFFGASFWGGGQDWKLGLSQEGNQKMYDLWQQFLPSADVCGIVVNSESVRGTAYFGQPAGNIFLTTLDARSLPHELGHAVANLADEYDRKGYHNVMEAPNMTQESDPKKVAWARYIGIDDISVYESTYNNGWYHPSKTCIMRSEDTGRFCQVCEDALRKHICGYCTADRLLFSSCGEQILESKTGTDMREYFAVQKRSVTFEGSQMPEELLLLTYYDQEGRAMEGPSGKVGNYSVWAEFLGYQTGGIVVYEPCILKVSYEIKPNPAKVFWLSVAPLFIGIVVWIAWLKLRHNRCPK